MLVETMMSIVIIGIAFLGLIAVFTGVFTNAAYDEVMTVSLMLAKGEMERASGLDFADIVDQNRDAPSAFTGDFTNYSWQVRIDPVPVDIADDAVMANYKQVEVRVTNVIAGDVSLKTIVSNP